jgi:hypothetical protein
MATALVVELAELYRTLTGQPTALIVMNPRDVTDEVREEIEKLGSAVELKESTFAEPGKGYILNLAYLDAEIGMLPDA